MNRLRLISVSYFVGIFLNLLIDFVPDDILGLNSVTSSVKTVSVLTVWWLFYFKIGWKLPLLSLILPRINLNGTWFGEYISHDDKGNTFSGDIAIRIKQDYQNIGVNSFTEQYEHHSYSEELQYNEKSDVHGIAYIYSQKENSVFDMAQRKGASELTLKHIAKVRWLKGDFWTIHGTRGRICVKWISKRHFDTFCEARNAAEMDG